MQPTRARARVSQYLFIAPAAALVGVYVYNSIAFNAYTSLFDWNGVSPTREFIGFGNYVALFSDDLFRSALINTFIFGAVSVTVQAAFGFVLAWWVRRRILFRGAFKAIYFAPIILSTAAVAPLARTILAPDGAVNQFVGAVTLSHVSQAWLADPATVLGTLCVINIWQNTGFSFVLYHAALTQIDPEIYDSARVDGASNFVTMTRIAWPLVRPTTAALLILGAIASLKTYELVFLVTRGGPAGASEVLSTYLYRQGILQFHAGYGSAIAMAMLAIALVLTVFQLRTYARRSR